MNGYLFEMHAHTSPVSRCAVSTVEELFELYKNTDYCGIVLTNHLNASTFKKRHMENDPWENKVEYFLSDYHKLKEIAGDRFTVLLGFEINFYDYENDYLVYGATEEFLRNNGDLMAMDIESFTELAHENGLLVLQAHPFRRDLTIVDWKILDGYEVFNGNPRHYSSNEIAAAWAKYHNKDIVVSGSDFHQPEDVAHGGIFFDKKPETNEQLLSALRNHEYTLYTPDFVHTREE